MTPPPRSGGSGPGQGDRQRGPGLRPLGYLGGKGFDKGEVLRYLSARDELITGMTLYQAALLGAVAAGSTRTCGAGLGRAQSLVAQAEAALGRFETHHIEALSAAGITRRTRRSGLPGS